MADNSELELDALANLGLSDEGGQQGGTAAADTKSSDPKPDAQPAAQRSATLLDEADKDKDGYVPPKSAAKDAKDESSGDWRKDLTEYTLAKLKGKVPDDVLEKRRTAMMNLFGRYKSERDFTIGGYAAMDKIRSGEYRAKPPADATAEDIAAWREENGIPKEAKGYDVPKIAGYKWTDADKPLIEDFKQFAHKSNYTQDQVNSGAEWYVKTVQESQEKYWAAISNADNSDKEVVKDQLRVEYGPDFRPSIHLLDRLLNDDEVMPGKLGQSILTARYTDGDGQSRRLINDPNMARMLINYAKDTYGEGAFITGDAKSTMSSRKAEIEKVMKEDYDRYWRDGMADEYGQILEQEEKAQGRRRSAA